MQQDVVYGFVRAETRAEAMLLLSDHVAKLYLLPGEVDWPGQPHERVHLIASGSLTRG
jgi:hypothetical protein